MIEDKNLVGIPTTKSSNLLVLCRNHCALGTKRGFRLHFQMIDNLGRFRVDQVDYDYLNTNGTVEAKIIPLYEGRLLSVQCEIRITPQVNALQYHQGDTWLSIFLSGEKPIPFALVAYEWTKQGALLAQGYIWQNSHLSWTCGQGTIETNYTNGPGHILYYNEVAVPFNVGAGNYIVTIPPGESWMFEDIMVDLQTANIGGNRRLFIWISDGGAINGFTVESQHVQAGNLSVCYNFIADLPYSYFGTVAVDPLPRRLLNPGNQLQISGIALDGNDNLNVIQYRYRRYIIV